MSIKKMLSAFSIAMALISSCSFAGTEDWNGQFKINFGNQVVDASHSPQKVKFLFFSAGKCLSFKKGANINGVEIKEDVSLCTDNNIPKFSQELQKLGAIVLQEVKPGPNYQE